MLTMVKGYCSGCYKLTRHTLEEQNYVRRNVYQCASCKARVVQCRVCQNMATTTDMWDSEFCAEHDGTIANFETLEQRLDDLADFEALFEKNSINMVKAGKIAGVCFLSAGLIGPAALAAAPAMGGVVGAKLLGYTGAAATKAGLAALGGGSIASGGAGMAGGIAVITATGSALGGALGGVVSNSYFGDIEGFSIDKVREGTGPSIIVIDGFLTQRKQHPKDWLDALQKTHPENPCYYVRWESKRLQQIGNILTVQVAKSGIIGALQGWALLASKEAARKFTPVSWLATATGFAANPWSVAMVKAEMAGVLLADIISRTDSQYILCGHSLGARVAHYALQSLATKSTKPQILQAHLLGGAVGNQRADWAKASKAVSGKIYNYHSKNDAVLEYLYDIGTGFFSKPIGRYKIVGVPQVENCDVSDLVNGHAAHKENFASFMRDTPKVSKPRKKAAKKVVKKAAAKKAAKATKKAVKKKVAKKAAAKKTAASRPAEPLPMM